MRTLGFISTLVALAATGCSVVSSIDVCDRAAPEEQGSNALPEGDQAVTLDRALGAWAPDRAYLVFASETASGFVIRSTFIREDGSPIAVCGADAEALLAETSVMAKAAIAAPQDVSEPGMLAFVDTVGGVPRVFAQYLRSDGCAVGDVVEVGQEASDEVVLEAPIVLALGDSTFVAAWTAARFVGGLPVENTLRTRVLRGNEAIGHLMFEGTAGSRAGDVVEVPALSFAPRGVTGVALGEGRFALLWSEIGSLTVGVSFAVLNSRLETMVAVPIFEASEGGLRVPEPPEVSVGYDGTQLLATWVVEDDSSATVLMGRFLTSSGEALRSADAPDGGAFRIAPIASGDQRSPAVVGLSRGGFLVVWAEGGADGDGSGIRAVAFDEAGTRQFVNPACDRNTFVVNRQTAGDQTRPAASQLLDGTVIVSWTDASRSGRDVSGSAVQTTALSRASLFPNE